MLNTAVNNYKIETVSGNSDGIVLETKRNGLFHAFTLSNKSGTAERIKEVAVFRQRMPYGRHTRFYGEGFNMLSQYWGNLEQIQTAFFSDRNHYKLPVKSGFFTVYNLIQFFPAESNIELAGFTSCKRFSNEIRFNTSEIEFVMVCDGIMLNPGESMELEEFCIISNGGREEQLASFAERTAFNHPPLPCNEVISGWCSWYCCGPEVTEQDILDNCGTMGKKLPGFRFVQIDDGYQKAMGDWLIPHANFPGGIKELCKKIKATGMEPAIWLAPFIAEESSGVFQQHPDWFVMDETGKPLVSSRNTFGGWRRGPWYMLDCSNPAACEYLRHVASVMRHEWGCRYFKLDANLWGCMPFGKRFDSGVTRVEAYRRGMQSIIDGAGENAVILGCNAPMWPSLGTCSAMRITGDISRRWVDFEELSKECFSRNWQNGKLWINDPDCIVLENLSIEQIGPDGKVIRQNKTSVAKQEFEFHKAHILASGGSLLSSDILTELSEESFETLRKLTECYGCTAKFDDTDFIHGTITLPDSVLHCYFNRSAQGKMFCRLPDGVCSDFWTDEPETEMFFEIPNRGARVIRVKI